MFFIFVFYSIVGYAGNCESGTAPFGTWSTSGTWDCGSPPSSSNCPDTIFITEEVYITSTVNLSSCPPIVMVLDNTLRFKSGRKLYLPTNSQIIINSGGSLEPEGGGGNSNLLTIGGSAVWNAGMGTITGPTILDIELISFTAELDEDEVKINWATASETDNNYFTIEHSTDGFNFSSIAIVEGAGTSNSTINYQVIHTNPKLGINYYRLMQTDFDGKYSYSETISLNYSYVLSKNIIYPNPANAYCFLAIAHSEELCIYNLGNELVLKSSDYYYGDVIPLNGLSKGVYFIQYLDKNILKTEKLIIN